MLATLLATVKETFRCFTSHGGRVFGAATAFYALLSVAPMLLIAIAITDALTAEAVARAQVTHDMGLWVGADGARVLEELLGHLAQTRDGPLAGVLGVVLLLYASQRLFSQLRYSLNHLWGVREVSGRGVKAKALKQLRKRLAAFAMVLVVVLVVVATVLAKTWLAAAENALALHVPTGWRVLELALSFALLTLLCAAIFKVLPAVRISFRDAAIGAVATALLFSVGTLVIGWYLGHKSSLSAYGAASSLVALLLWASYSAQVFFLGASFARVYAERHGDGLEPTEGAVRIVEES